MSEINNQSPSDKPVSPYLIPILLTGILFVQFLILLRLPPPPPTIHDLQTTDPGSMAALMGRTPIVRIQGGNINADVSNTPLDVHVTNFPRY